MDKRLTVLVVDDSAFARATISNRLDDDPEIGRVETARDGQEALDKIESVAPDVITMDIQMPRLDGLGALQQVMSTRPTPVVMLSNQANGETDATLNALELGAVDFFLKPSIADATGGGGSGDRNLVETIKLAADVPVARLAESIRQESRPEPPSGSGGVSTRSANAHTVKSLEGVIVIAASTGGPRALAQVVPYLPADDRVAYLIVHHMPDEFTRSLAKRLDNGSLLNVREAEKGEFIEGGSALMAPGGSHLVVASNGEMDLTDSPALHGMRPAADHTMQSVARGFGRKSMGVVLTGVGADGRDGAAAIRAAGGPVIVEDESTCVAFGMPRAVVDAGHATSVVQIDKIAPQIVSMYEPGLSASAAAA